MDSQATGQDTARLDLVTLGQALLKDILILMELNLVKYFKACMEDHLKTKVNLQ